MSSFTMRLAVTVLATAAVSASALAQSDPYKITVTEKAACTYDAERLCADAYPDEGKLLSCMQQNRSALSRVCAVAFDAGLRRRHLVAR